MRDYELELVAALAEGRLEDETEARALLASSPELQAEYEAQRTALDAVASASTASLNESERAALRRDVWTELRSPGTSRRTSAPWYYRWVPVGAGLLVLVGVLAVLNPQGGGDEGIVTAQMDSADTTLAASETTNAGATLEGDDASEEGGEAAPTDQATDGGLADEGLGRALTPSDMAFFAAQADDIRSGLDAHPEAQSFDDDPSLSELSDCMSQAGLEGYEIHDVYPAPEETGESGTEAPRVSVPYFAAIHSGVELATAAVAFVDLLACEVIHIDR